MITNWFAFILVVLVPMLVIIGMGTVLLVTYITERREQKRRDRRWHQPVQNWWELKAE